VPNPAQIEAITPDGFRSLGPMLANGPIEVQLWRFHPR
jgi:hypothetical protein